jgi:DNA processing protein
MEHNLQDNWRRSSWFKQIYPKTHKKYVAKVEQNGGFMTEFWSLIPTKKTSCVEIES